MRGIAISPIISKIFEYCVIDRFEEFSGAADNQFGFRKGLSCSHAVYSTRCIVYSILKMVTQLTCVQLTCRQLLTKLTIMVFI